MLELEIPGKGVLSLKHLVLDFNGTLAVDGRIVDCWDRLDALQKYLQIHVVTADTYGNVQKQIAPKNYTLHVLGPASQDQAKLAYIQKLGARHCVCLGNGLNDVLMLKQAGLGIAVLQKEGAASQAILAADVVVTNFLDGLELLLYPLRLKATLRN